MRSSRNFTKNDSEDFPAARGDKGATILVVENLYKEYVKGSERVRALEDVNFAAYPGGFVSIIGPSGCGKSTLLSVAGGLLAPTEGSVQLEGSEVTGPRPDRIGFSSKSTLCCRGELLKRMSSWDLRFRG